MSIILCKKKADRPYYHAKLNIAVRSEQELAYIVYNYPLLCIDGFADERLFSWIENQLQNKRLANTLRVNAKAGESIENQLLCILQECSYYDVDEVVEFGKEMAKLRKCTADELVRREARLLYAAGKYQLAYEKLSESARMLDAAMRKMKNGPDKTALKEKKADVLCDMAVISLRMSDENKALELLISSELTYYNKRAVKMRYLINGAGDLSDEAGEELDRIKAEAAADAHNTKGYREIESLFEKDSIRILKEARLILSRWKNNYRMM